jgi:hypothetical protein
MLFTILIVLMIASLAGGAWGHRRYGYAGWSPVGLMLLLFVVFWFTGNLRYG